MSSEPAAISSTERVSATRRPTRSAMRPKYQAPIGRMRKPIAKTRAALINCAVASAFGKKTGAK